MKNRITIPSHSYQLIPIPTPFPFLKDLLQFPLKSKYRFPFLPVPCPKKTDWICVLIILWPYKVPHHTSEMSLQIAMQEQQGVQLIKSRFNCIYDLIQTLQEWFDQTVWYDTDFVESSHKADGNLHVQYIPISSHSHSNSCEKGFTFLFSWDPWEFPNLAHLYAAVESRSRPSCNRCTTGYNSFCSSGQGSAINAWQQSIPLNRQTHSQTVARFPTVSKRIEPIIDNRNEFFIAAWRCIHRQAAIKMPKKSLGQLSPKYYLLGLVVVGLFAAL